MSYVFRGGRMVHRETGAPMNLEPLVGAFPLPMSISDIEPYISPETGRYVSSRSVMREDMASGGWFDARDLPKRETHGKLKNPRFAKKHGLEHMLHESVRDTTA